MAEPAGEKVALTQRERAIADALYADTWTEPNPKYGDEWHRRFPWWMCVRAARLVAALDGVQGLPQPDGPSMDLLVDERGIGERWGGSDA